MRSWLGRIRPDGCALRRIFHSNLSFHMDSSSSPSLLTRIVQGVLGALGLYAIVRFLPRLVSSLVKRFFLGVIGEILLVVLGTLLTQQVAQRLTGWASGQHNGRRPAPESPDAAHP